MARVPSEQQVKYMEEHASDDKGPVAIVVNVVCLAIASIAVALRFTSHRNRQHPLQFHLLGLPMPLVWRIKTSKAKRWRLTITFAIGTW